MIHVDQIVGERRAVRRTKPGAKILLHALGRTVGNLDREPAAGTEKPAYADQRAYGLRDVLQPSA